MIRLKGRKDAYRITAFSIAGMIAVYWGFIAVDAQEAGNLFISLGYWMALLLFLLWGYSIQEAYKKVFISYLTKKSTFVVIGISFLAALFLYTREGGGFRIIFDEYMLSNTALNMHRDRIPVVTETSLQGVQTLSGIDKRPLFFPLMLSLAHDVFGYRPENAFYLNFSLTATFLALQFFFLEKFFNKATASIGLILWVCTPLLEQNSGGGGFEILNIFLLLVCIVTAIAYWQIPDGPRLSALLLTGIALANVRYESAIFLVPMVIAIVARHARGHPFRMPLITVLIPLLFLPLAWQFRYVLASPDFWQTKLEGPQSFSLLYLQENIVHAFRFFFGYSPIQVNIPIIGIVGSLSSLFIVYHFFKKKAWKESGPEVGVLYLFFLFIAIHFLFILTFTYGQVDDPLVSRLALPFIFLLLVSSGIALGYIWTTKNKLRHLVYIVLFATVSSSLPLYANPKYSEVNPMGKRIEWILHHARQRKDENSLYITYAPKALELYKINNMSFARARNRSEFLREHLRLGTYNNIYIIQSGMIGVVDGRIVKQVFQSNREPHGCLLEPIDEISYFPYHFTRISRLRDFEESPTEESSSQGGPLELYRPLDKKAVSVWENSLP